MKSTARIFLAICVLGAWSGACKKEKKPSRRAPVKAAKPAPPAMRYKIYKIGPHLRPDPRLEAMIQPYRKKLKASMSRVIGTLPTTLRRARPESGLGNLVAGAGHMRLREAGYKVDVFITNFGGIRNPMGKGDITVGSVFECLPFENALITVKVTGAELKKIFRAVIKRGGEPISGARIRFSKKQDALVDVQVGREPLREKKSYLLGSVDYVSMTGFLKPYLSGKKLNKTHLKLRDALLWALQKKNKNGKVVGLAKVDGRVVIAP